MRLRALRSITLFLTIFSLISLQANAQGPTASLTADGEATYQMPPTGFNPLLATTTQLAEYGFPPRPTSQAQLPAWKALMAAAKNYVIPVFANGPQNIDFQNTPPQVINTGSSISK